MTEQATEPSHEVQATMRLLESMGGAVMLMLEGLENSPALVAPLVSMPACQVRLQEICDRLSTACDDLMSLASDIGDESPVV